MERSFLAAYQARDEAAFRWNLAEDYFGIAPDGRHTADGEIAKMHRFRLTTLELHEEKVTQPTPEVAIGTYRMQSEGTFAGQTIAGSLYTSTVYVHRGGAWKAVLHTESLVQPA